MNRLRNDNPPTLIDDGFYDAPEPPAPRQAGCALLLLVAVLWLLPAALRAVA